MKVIRQRPPFFHGFFHGQHVMVKDGPADNLRIFGQERIHQSVVIGVLVFCKNCFGLRKRNIKRHLKNQLPNFQDIQDHILENDMAYICEYLAKKYHISREVQIKSIQKALAARAHIFYPPISVL